jgi:hypothetical protein
MTESPLSDDHVIFIPECIGKPANKIEQSIAARRNVGAMLDIAVRPEALSGGIVALIEQRIEGFENQRLVLFGRRDRHVVLHAERAGAAVVIPRAEMKHSAPAASLLTSASFAAVA